MSNIIDDIIRREGGYVDHPADRGGPTKFGITQETLSTWRQRPVQAGDVQALSEYEARRIYQRRYLEQPKFDCIHDGPLRELVVDCGVNHGPRRAARWLQDAAGVAPDGVVGPVTLEAVNGGFASRIFYSVISQRIQFYGALISRDPSQAVFAEGWMRRVAEFLEGTA